MHKLKTSALIFALAFACFSGCAVSSKNRNPSQEDFEVKLKDNKGKYKVAPPAATTTDGKNRVAVNPSDEEAKKQAQAVKVAVANAVEKAESNYDRVTSGPMSQNTSTSTNSNLAKSPPPEIIDDEVTIEKDEMAAIEVHSVAATPDVASKKIVSTPPPQPSRTAGPVPPERSLQWLKNGNIRFVKGFLRQDGASAQDRLRTAQHASPHAVIITSSDSRLPPEIIFDQKLGEIYVLRLADIDVQSPIKAALHDGINEFGANLVVVLGAEGLGVWSHPQELSETLTETSKILRDAVASGSVKVTSALYNPQTGTVTWVE